MFLTRKDNYYDEDGIWGNFEELFKTAFPVVNTQLRCGTKQTDEGTLITLVAPGLEKKDFHIGVVGNALTISYDVSSSKEKSYTTSKKFSQSWTLNTRVEPSKIVASYEQGVLKVLVPKVETVDKVTEIQVR